MNKIITLAFLLALSTITGCVNAPSEQLTPEQQEFRTALRIQRGVRLAVLLGVATDLRKHPDRRPAYEKAEAGVASLVTNEKWDTLAFSSALSESGSTVFSSGDITLAIQVVPLLIDTVSGDRIDLTQVKYLKPAIIGASEGLQQALDSTK